ncbi:glutathione peroxidase [Raphidocelis subcapitata]|uniref:Glutathione peroxidase n=1 Tax=Raphidocelis subcapitata TaxID=307507 RepID=A0A2V0PL84_9CHLO|nr:glutathione peroxidase [Raphidocelis subcapitata]|eukprot:GBF97775.1 glutathione peroxidase [Raphidocelis subcapitata]
MPGPLVIEASTDRLALCGGALLAGASGLLPPPSLAEPGSAYEFSLPQYDEQVALAERYRGKVTVFNVAYPGLRTLLEKYGPDGFDVVAAPCNQFGGQAPLSDEEEREVAYRKFGVRTFQIYDHIQVNGPDAHPLYKFLKAALPNDAPGSQRPLPGMPPGEITWNYTKFLVGRDGAPLARYKPGFDPLDFEADVRLALAGLQPRPSNCLLHPGAKGCSVAKLLREAGKG